MLDLYDLQKGTKYEDGYTEDSPIIGQFWTVVFEFTEEEKKLLLKFISGRYAVYYVRCVGNV